MTELSIINLIKNERKQNNAYLFYSVQNGIDFNVKTIFTIKPIFKIITSRLITTLLEHSVTVLQNTCTHTHSYTTHTHTKITHTYTYTRWTKKSTLSRSSVGMIPGEGGGGTSILTVTGTCRWTGYDFAVITIDTGYLNRPNWLLADYSVYNRVASQLIIPPHTRSV